MNRYTKQLAGGAVAGLLFWASATPALAQARPALIRDVDRPSAVFDAVCNLIKPMDSVGWLGAKRRHARRHGEALQRR